MGFINNVVLGANKGFNRLPGLLEQAKSYATNPAMLRARGAATQLAKGTWAASKSFPAVAGGVAGGAIGAGYEYATNPNADWRSSLAAGVKGSAYGTIAGMGYYGYKAAGKMPGIKSSLRTGWQKGSAVYGANAGKVKNWWETKVAYANYMNEFEATGGF
jgi:hypothetical protein